MSVSWQGKSDDYSDSDPHLAELLCGRRGWEIAQQRKQDGDFWWHFSIVVAILVGGVFVLTVMR